MNKMLDYCKYAYQIDEIKIFYMQVPQKAV